MIFGHRPAVPEAMARQAHADGHGHFSPATCGTERVITLPREKPSHMELRVGAKRRSRYRGKVAPFALPSSAKQIVCVRLESAASPAEPDRRVANNRPCLIGSKASLSPSRG